MIRTLTMHYTGKIVRLTRDEILLDSAAWITSSGRWNAALVNGVLDEVEPYPGLVNVNRHAVVDVTSWDYVLPREVK